jgi:hypothetical protein
MIFLIPTVVYGVLCLLVTLLAFRSRGGPILYLALSIALTPIVGLLILMLANPDFARPRPKSKIDG